MTDRLSFEKPVGHLAQILLNKLKINQFPVDPRDIVKSLGLFYFERNLGDSFDGCILFREGLASIVINGELSETRKRFTIAHELGHFNIHSDQNMECLAKNINSAYAHEIREREANKFAVELLMPEHAIKSIVKSKEVSIKAIEEIANLFGSSLSSSALRFIEYTDELAALIVCENRTIKYKSLSRDLRSKYSKYKFEPKNVLDKDASAYDFFDSTGAVIKHNRIKIEALPSTWFPDTDSSMVDCYEETIGFPSYGQTLSLIWINEKNTY